MQKDPPRRSFVEAPKSSGSNAAAFLVLTIAAGWILLPDLGHPYITRWDESVHLGVARALLRSPFEPRLYADPLFAAPRSDPWTETGIFLHKPTLPFWLAALLLRLTGITPLALRLVSALAALATSLTIFLLARRLAGAAWALVAALAFLSLPFGWTLVQGYQFGDVTDCTLAACVSMGMWLLLRAAEEGGLQLFAASGAMVGLGYLCKSGLALTPLGVALAIALLGRLRLVESRVSLPALATMVAAAVAIAAPWNLYCLLRWPAEFHLESLHTARHFTGQGLEQWVRSGDALLNEINQLELRPFPVVLPLLAVGWLTFTAAKSRSLPAVLCALWVCSEWIVLSIARVKVPAVAWGAVPAVFAGLALLGRSSWRRPALALSVLVATQLAWLMARAPRLGQVRSLLVSFLDQTASRPGLAEGLVALAVAAALGGALSRLRGHRWKFWVAAALGSATLASFLWLLIWRTAQARAETARIAHDELALVSYGRDLAGLDPAVPRASVFFLDYVQDARWSGEATSLLFWTGRMAYRAAPDLGAARAHGQHPYLVSSLAQPYRSLGEVPPGSWARAYDLEEPAEPPPLPVGITPLSQKIGAMEVLGFAASAGDAHRDRYVFFLRSHGPPVRLRVTFLGEDGPEERLLDPNASLESEHDLANAPWFLVPTTAQRRSRLTELEFEGGGRVPLR